MIDAPIPGLSIRLYQLFAEATGRWSTPHWMMGVSTGRPLGGYKPLLVEWKPLKMITT